MCSVPLELFPYNPELPIMKTPDKNSNAFANLLMLCFFLLGACSQQAKPVDPSTLPVPVHTVKVAEGAAGFSTQYPATVNALNQTDLRTNVSGYITGIFFKEGHTVQKGQKLYEIDKSKYQAGYDQAIASYNISKANLDRADQDAQRYQNLLKQDAIARQQVDHALTDQQNARLQVVVARQGIKNAATDLRYSEIVAPFSGVIGLSQVRLGALVQSGQTLLNTVSSVDPIAVDVVVSEQDLPLFQRYYKEKLPLTDSIFTLVLPDRSVYTGLGRITVIDRAIDPQTGTLTVRISFPNKQRLLTPGMNVTMNVREGRGIRSMMIPAKAVTEVMGELFVFIVKDNKVHEQKIVQGKVIGDKLVVKSGIALGDEIVTEGMGRLKEGSLIKKN